MIITREKGIDVGIYLALCDFGKPNLHVGCRLVLIMYDRMSVRYVYTGKRAHEIPCSF